jgi:shikimate dehydrogenase
MINAKTTLYGLVGYPVEHSLSPMFWNAAFKELKTNSVYVALPVTPDKIIPAIIGLKESGFKGLNITRPHKESVAKICNILHDAANITKVVNTLKFSSTNIEGWNTDASGFLNILKKFNLPQTKVLILGNGASSKSILWALQKYGVQEIFQIARKFIIESEEKKEIYNGEKIILRKLSWNLKNFNNSIKESDIIINTTSIGWSKEDNIEGFSNYLNTSKCFIDLNYNKDSNILAIAHKNCGLTIDGRELLYEQGIEAFKILTNLAPSAEVIRSIIFD